MEENYSYRAQSISFHLLVYKYIIKALVSQRKMDSKKYNKTLVIFFMKKIVS